MAKERDLLSQDLQPTCLVSASSAPVLEMLEAPFAKTESPLSLLLSLPEHSAVGRKLKSRLSAFHSRILLTSFSCSLLQPSFAESLGFSL